MNKNYIKITSIFIVITFLFQKIMVKLKIIENYMKIIIGIIGTQYLIIEKENPS